MLGEQSALVLAAARAGVDLVHSLASTAPAWGRFRRVVTVHDLIYARYPEAHTGLRGRGMRVLVPLAARRSDRVIADSEYGREDLIRLLGVSPERIDVVPLGLGAVRRVEPLPEAQHADAVRPGLAADRAEPVGQAPAQEPRGADQLHWRGSRARTGRCWCSPAT